MEKISRKQAKADNISRYFTGKPCKRGHIAQRVTRCSTCVECNKEYKTRWRLDNPEKQADAQNRWRERNPERCRAHWRKSNSKNRERRNEQSREHYKRFRARKLEGAAQYREKNREILRQKQRRYHEENKDQQAERSKRWRKSKPEKKLAYDRQWRLNNLSAARAATAARKARKAERTPPWADLNAIAKVYAQARLATAVTGLDYHVDHVIPLRGTNVSGLHVAENLQILEAGENLRKGNKFNPPRP